MQSLHCRIISLNYFAQSYVSLHWTQKIGMLYIVISIRKLSAHYKILLSPINETHKFRNFEFLILGP